ncbi:MAG TPA: hypothetical protein VM118_02365 [Acidobacteriota bacterium]|nr:hypothetical protein [Acidobacteriota bacterium]
MDNGMRQFYDLAQHQLTRQHESLGRLHVKMSTILGFGFVLIGLILNATDHLECIWMIVVPLVPLFAGLVVLIGGYRVRSYGNAPNIALVKWHKDQGKGASQLLSEAVDEMAKSFSNVEMAMTVMKRRINWSSWLLLLGSLLAAVMLCL